MTEDTEDRDIKYVKDDTIGPIVNDFYSKMWDQMVSKMEEDGIDPSKMDLNASFLDTTITALLHCAFDHGKPFTVRTVYEVFNRVFDTIVTEAQASMNVAEH